MECKGHIAEGFDYRPFHYRVCEVKIRFEGKGVGEIVMVLTFMSCGLILRYLMRVLYAACNLLHP